MFFLIVFFVVKSKAETFSKSDDPFLWYMSDET